MENNIENINDRLTDISNQRECEQQSSTDALSLINDELSGLNSDFQSKTGTILFKTQSIFDRVKTPPNLASVTRNQACNQSKSQFKNKSSSQSQKFSATNDQVMDTSESAVATPENAIGHTSQPQHTN